MSANEVGKVLCCAGNVSKGSFLSFALIAFRSNIPLQRAARLQLLVFPSQSFLPKKSRQCEINKVSVDIHRASKVLDVQSFPKENCRRCGELGASAYGQS